MRWEKNGLLKRISTAFKRTQYLMRYVKYLFFRRGVNRWVRPLVSSGKSAPEAFVQIPSMIFKMDFTILSLSK